MCGRHFPLTQAHAHADDAAEASEIAGSFGKLWEMHHILYDNQDALDDESLVDYASQLGISEDVFVEQLASHIFQKRVHTEFLLMTAIFRLRFVLLSAASEARNQP